MGDFLADRGQNDLMTLRLLEGLETEGMRTEITASNHDMFFLNEYYKTDPSAWGASSRFYGQYVNGIRSLVSDGIISQEGLSEMMDRVYFPNFKLLSYALTNNDKKITLFMHAPNGIEPIKDLAGELGVEYADKTAKDLAKTIDAINWAFQNLRYTDNAKFREMVRLAAEFDINTNNSSLTALVWNMGKGNVDGKYELSVALPNYVEKVVHGHVGEPGPKLPAQYETLDTNLGKMHSTDLPEGYQGNFDAGVYVDHSVIEPVWAKRYEITPDNLLKRMANLRDEMKASNSVLKNTIKEAQAFLQKDVNTLNDMEIAQWQENTRSFVSTIDEIKEKSSNLRLVVDRIIPKTLPSVPGHSEILRQQFDAALVGAEFRELERELNTVLSQVREKINERNLKLASNVSERVDESLRLLPVGVGAPEQQWIKAEARGRVAQIKRDMQLR
ncbi:MAG: hypothetical protein ACD_21C00188G0003 [uncultured bacterium]|nr:MAG: hypothetical protein ACD_21C00188G0003 [uncultured bacterium]